MKRWDVINILLEGVEKDITSYLEIGVAKAQTLQKINADIRIGVDPAGFAATCHMTSDRFFGLDHPISSIMFDIIFIDGLHVDVQVIRDIVNAGRRLNQGGYIVLHDANPQDRRIAQDTPDETLASWTWTGSVWWAVANVLGDGSFRGHTINTDYGCTVIQPTGAQTRQLPPRPDFSYLENNRKGLLHLIEPEEFVKLYGGGICR